MCPKTFRLMNNTNLLKAFIILKRDTVHTSTRMERIFLKNAESDITHLTRYLSHRSLYPSVRTSRELIWNLKRTLQSV